MSNNGTPGNPADDYIAVKLPRLPAAGTYTPVITWSNPCPTCPNPTVGPAVVMEPSWLALGPACNAGGVSNDNSMSKFPELAESAAAGTWLAWEDNGLTNAISRVFLKKFNPLLAVWNSIANDNFDPVDKDSADAPSDSLDYGIGVNSTTGFGLPEGAKHPDIALYGNRVIVAFSTDADIIVRMYDAGTGLWTDLKDTNNDPLGGRPDDMDMDNPTSINFNFNKSDYPSIAVFDNPNALQNDYLYVAWSDQGAVSFDQRDVAGCGPTASYLTSTSQVRVRRINLTQVLLGNIVWEHAGVLDSCETPFLPVPTVMTKNSDDDEGISNSQGAALHPDISVVLSGASHRVRVAYIDDNAAVAPSVLLTANPPARHGEFHLRMKQLIVGNLSAVANNPWADIDSGGFALGFQANPYNWTVRTGLLNTLISPEGSVIGSTTLSNTTSVNTRGNQYNPVDLAHNAANNPYVAVAREGADVSAITRRDQVVVTTNNLGLIEEVSPGSPVVEDRNFAEPPRLAFVSGLAPVALYSAQTTLVAANSSANDLYLEYYRGSSDTWEGFPNYSSRGMGLSRSNTVGSGGATFYYPLGNQNAMITRSNNNDILVSWAEAWRAGAPDTLGGVDTEICVLTNPNMANSGILPFPN